MAAADLEFLWYVPNTVESGHRGDDTAEGWGSLDFSAAIAQTAEAHGFAGALIGAGWGRTDTFTLATALAARTRRFQPLAAIRPGYWQPAQFACAAATLDQLSEGRLLVNIVTGKDAHRAYGDFADDPASRYARTREFMQLVRRLWTEEDVTFEGRFYRVEHSTCLPRPYRRPHPPLYFGGASEAAEQVAAAEADVQLMWGEPLAMAAERIERLRRLSAVSDRARPLEFGLRVTVVVRETSAEAWRDAEAKLGGWEGQLDRRIEKNVTGAGSVGQQRLRQLIEAGEVLDRCLWTAPARVGTGAASTWLVGSAEEVVASLRDYIALGISHFILSDTPYHAEAERVGGLVVSRLRSEAAKAGLGTLAGHHGG
ncbi:MAG TPA: LLM class flavin-dependent oxidoreductase [Dehalococcoidia bacterium]|nr:LLM class flavin-dependent oxidoreductase [Dehalococcoidia bacterium]